MKTLEEILRAPRPLKEGGRAVNIETTEVFDVVNVGELHAMCESYGTSHTMALSQLVHIKDAIDCGLVDGWRGINNPPNDYGPYLVVTATHDLQVAFFKGYFKFPEHFYGNKTELAWRDLPTLPEWV